MPQAMPQLFRNVGRKGRHQQEQALHCLVPGLGMCQRRLFDRLHGIAQAHQGRDRRVKAKALNVLGHLFDRLVHAAPQGGGDRTKPQRNAR